MSSIVSRESCSRGRGRGRCGARLAQPTRGFIPLTIHAKSLFDSAEQSATPAGDRTSCGASYLHASDALATCTAAVSAGGAGSASRAGDCALRGQVDRILNVQEEQRAGGWPSCIEDQSMGGGEARHVVTCWWNRAS